MMALSSENQTRTTLRRRYENIEQRRQRILVYLGNGLAGVFLLLFGISAVYEQRHTLALFTLSHAGITLANILLFKFTRNHDWAHYGFGYGMLALFTYLLASGGVEQTGPLWSFPMVVAAIVLLGSKRGLTVVSLMLSIALVLFFVPLPWLELATYSLNFKIRFIAAFLALSLFAVLHEYARARNQNELIRISTRMDQLSRTDTLTTLPNRRYMIDRLETENSRFRRHGRPYSILFGDVDNFKSINDRYGHQLGDAVLMEVALAIRGCLRQHDEVCRWGGEEFLVLLPESGQDVACEVAEKLRSAVAAIKLETNGAALPLTISFGVHTVDVEDGVDTFIHLADQKLYQAKKAGKNRVVAETEFAA